MLLHKHLKKRGNNSEKSTPYSTMTLVRITKQGIRKHLLLVTGYRLQVTVYRLPFTVYRYFLQFLNKTPGRRNEGDVGRQASVEVLYLQA